LMYSSAALHDFTEHHTFDAWFKLIFALELS
jgi:hypothetical protein